MSRSEEEDTPLAERVSDHGGWLLEDAGLQGAFVDLVSDVERELFELNDAVPIEVGLFAEPVDERLGEDAAVLVEGPLILGASY
jgi:hypothetical protein